MFLSNISFCSVPVAASELGRSVCVLRRLKGYLHGLHRETINKDRQTRLSICIFVFDIDAAHYC